MREHTELEDIGDAFKVMRWATMSPPPSQWYIDFEKLSKRSEKAELAASGARRAGVDEMIPELPGVHRSGGGEVRIQHGLPDASRVQYQGAKHGGWADPSNADPRLLQHVDQRVSDSTGYRCTTFQPGTSQEQQGARTSIRYLCDNFILFFAPITMRSQ